MFSNSVVFDVEIPFSRAEDLHQQSIHKKGAHRTSKRSLAMPAPSRWWLSAALALCGVAVQAQELCIADTSIFGEPIYEETCCQNDVCAIPCPEPVDDPGVGTYAL